MKLRNFLAKLVEYNNMQDKIVLHAIQRDEDGNVISRVEYELEYVSTLLIPHTVVLKFDPQKGKPIDI